MSNLKGRNVRVREGQWHYRFNLDGQEYSGPTGLDGTKRHRKKAEEFAAYEKQRVQGEQQRAAPVPFSQAAGEFVSWCENVEYRSKANTAARIRTSIKSAVHFFGNRPVQQLDAGAIEKYKSFRIEEHGIRDITLRHDLHALSVFFRKYAIKMGWAKSNPIEEVTIPSDKDAVREHVVSQEEEEKYFTAAGRLHEKHLKSHPKAQPNMADVARLMLEQGARPEEILAARVENFDAAKGTLRITGGKTKAARRTLNLTAASIAILERRANLGSPWLFPSDRHPGHHLTKLVRTHDRIKADAGVAFVIYDFRHTWATRAIEAKNPVAIVAAIMGHSSLRTIHRYVHPSSEAQKLAMEEFEAAQQRKKLKVVGK